MYDIEAGQKKRDIKMEQTNEDIMGLAIRVTRMENLHGLEAAVKQERISQKIVSRNYNVGKKMKQGQYVEQILEGLKRRKRKKDESDISKSSDSSAEEELPSNKKYFFIFLSTGIPLKNFR